MDNYNLQNMVQDQIIARHISDDNVIKAFKNIDRRLFVPNSLAQNAYEDTALPIGYNQTISQPYIVALMTQAAKLNKDCNVLEIGTGSGYQAAILSKLCKEVYTIEVIEPLGQEVTTRFQKLGFKNIHVKIGDGYKGWPDHAPYDAIIVTAAPEEAPETLIKQLKNGGRMIIPVGEYIQELVRITKYDNKTTTENLESVRFVPMIHRE